ncbi:uncharacterized protein [Clytia hemisphaerica]|uniref:N-acetyltransferase domain-containing protein n=1 Tax=Clytia hemisphaerica TaxID=252671 RepID=A0A7M5XE05_9CNID|eukprot:TCONS_00050884-protein
MATSSVGKILRQPITQRLLNSSFALHQGSKLTSQASRRMNDYYLSFINDSCACPYVTKGQYMSSVLTDHRDIKQAQGLLFNNYSERHWCWSNENPTGFQVKQSSSMNYVIDKFDKDSAMWFGTFDEDQLVTAIRLCFRTTENPLMDIELYQQSPEKLELHNALRRDNVVEISRFVTAPQYRSNGIGGTLSLLSMFMFLSKYNYTAIFTSQLDFFGKYGIGTLLDRTFDYGDGIHTKAWFYSRDDVEEIATMLKKKVNK